MIKGIIISIGIVMLLLNANYVYSLYRNVDPIPYITGQISRDDYIRKFRPEYEVIRYTNHHLHSNTSMLCLFMGNRRYYFDKQPIMNVNVLKRALSSSHTIDQVRSRLRDLNITHIILRYDLFANWLENSLDPTERALLDRFFFMHTTKIRSYGGYGLYELM
ncbi:hypothetical protein DSCO28_00680 [Desulfosarcina ovata subsp. sediminis]|uniref:Uncharacterized protein n=2 Tax=Desulfosarcina ovata TaxID=83564 RepID=A0A5K7ZC11_9BACT|nr:hypothetical protein DSCO28_00680 [Desulfosarcina ovata subsp. sediminis]